MILFFVVIISSSIHAQVVLTGNPCGCYTTSDPCTDIKIQIGNNNSETDCDGNCPLTLTFTFSYNSSEEWVIGEVIDAPFPPFLKGPDGTCIALGEGQDWKYFVNETGETLNLVAAPEMDILQEVYEFKLGKLSVSGALLVQSFKLYFVNSCCAPEPCTISPSDLDAVYDVTVGGTFTVIDFEENSGEDRDAWKWTIWKNDTYQFTNADELLGLAFTSGGLLDPGDNVSRTTTSKTITLGGTGPASAPGNFDFKVCVEDPSNSEATMSCTELSHVNIEPLPVDPVEIHFINQSGMDVLVVIPHGRECEKYELKVGAESYKFKATGGLLENLHYEWTLEGPDWLHLSSTSGETTTIKGCPLKESAGSYGFTVKVTETNSGLNANFSGYSIMILDNPEITAEECNPCPINKGLFGSYHASYPIWGSSSSIIHIIDIEYILYDWWWGFIGPIPPDPYCFSCPSLSLQADIFINPDPGNSFRIGATGSFKMNQPLGESGKWNVFLGQGGGYFSYSEGEKGSFGIVSTLGLRYNFYNKNKSYLNNTYLNKIGFEISAVYIRPQISSNENDFIAPQVGFKLPMRFK